jgi:hypothetical protein
MANLPTDHGSNNVWGQELIDFLSVGHNANGSLKTLASTERICYVSPRGSDTNDGLSWATAKLTLTGAFNAFTGDNVIVKLGYSTTTNPISTGGAIDLSGKSGIMIEGLGSGNHLSVPTRGQPNTVLSHSGTGSGIILNMQEARSCTLRGFRFQYTSASFTGTMIHAGSPVGYSFPSTNHHFEDLYIGSSSSSIYTAAYGIKLDNSIMITIDRCDIAYCVNGIGRLDPTLFATNIRISNTRFEGNTTRHITNVAASWVIENCTFEALQNGGARAICNDSDAPAAGVLITGCWFGDVVTGVGGNQINMKMEGGAIIGNFIATKATGACVVVGNNSSGFIIQGNQFYGSSTAAIGVVMGTGCTNYDVSSNFEALLTGVDVFPRRSADKAVAESWFRLHNTSTTDGRSVIEFAADRTSAKTYLLGIDPTGGNAKAFILRDSVSGDRLQVPTDGGLVVGSGSSTQLATNATGGFLWINSMAGAPTGNPARGNFTAMVFDTTNKRIYVWDPIGAAWRYSATT